MYSLHEKLKVVNLISTYFSTTPNTLSTPIGSMIDTRGFKEALICVNIATMGTNNTFAIKLQHTANAAGGTLTDLGAATVDGVTNTTAVFPTMIIDSALSSLERKMAIRLQDGYIERYLIAHVTHTGTFPSGAVISVQALLSGSESTPLAGKTA